MRTFSHLAPLAAPLLSLLIVPCSHAELDQNSNSQSDIWELQYQALGLTALGDADHDGFTNAQESIAGTNPLSATSIPRLSIEPDGRMACSLKSAPLCKPFTRP